MANNQFIPRARTHGLVVEELGDEVMVYDLDRNLAQALNPTAALVWKNCDGKRSVADVQRVLGRELQQPVGESVVWYALEQLDRCHLLEAPIRTPVALNGITRREFITKFALAAAVVPVVKSIQVPGPAELTSCANLGETCNAVTGPPCCPTNVCVAGTCQIPDCFVAGTRIAFADGTLRPIETVRVGDAVIARDDQTGKLAAQQVEKTFIHIKTHTLLLHLANDEVIGTTDVHPFFSNDGWVRAGALKASNHCTGQNGKKIAIRKIERPASKLQYVYNLEVSNTHNFFVAFTGVWVHNKG